VTELAVTVLGRPAPEGSHELGANGHVMHSSKYLALWRFAVKRDTRKAFLAAGITPDDMPLIPYPRPVYLSITHYVLDEQCRAEGTDEPTGSPDADKLLRATIDGLGEARVFGNDSQVKAFYSEKVRGNALAGAMIIISDKPLGEINTMTQQYRLSLELVGRDADGDRTWETIVEANGSAEELARFDLPGIAARLGAVADVVVPEPAEPAKPAKRAPRKATAAPAPEPVAEAAQPAAPATGGIGSADAVAAVASAPVNPFAR
jgi:Holliday junction resolvase RusA-like endonuclease